MAWTVNSAIQVQNLVSQIGTNLAAGGWTVTDSTNKVYSSVNSQGATQYLQVSQGGTYQYIQLQGFSDWSGGVGANGSGTSIFRIYFSSTVTAGTSTVDLYMSTSTNRVLIYIEGLLNYRNWAYFGGLDTAVAGTSDPTCVCLVTAYQFPTTNPSGYMMQAPQGGQYWAPMRLCIPYATANYDQGMYANNNIYQGLYGNGGKLLLHPILVADYSPYYSGGTIGAPNPPRGYLDGPLFCPVSQGGFVGHLDTATISGTTYLFVIPGGEVSGDTHPLTGNYVHALALPEV